MNGAFAERVLRALADAGVRELCVCPGGRNSPIVTLLADSSGCVCRYFFDERSAAFFALGRARASERPVAVITTSGTAAAELLPAAVEARYSGTPLVLVTADRPKRHRGTGAPQSIEQVGLYGVYAPTIFDGGTDDAPPSLAAWDGTHPVHVNVCFDEPLVDEPGRSAQFIAGAPQERVAVADAAPLETFVAEHDAAVVILGPIAPRDVEAVREFVLAYGRPVYAEATSRLRDDPALSELVIRAGERIFKRHPPPAVLRIGGVPTLRLWRDLERMADVPLLSVSRTAFPGLPGRPLVTGPLDGILTRVTPHPMKDQGNQFAGGLWATDRQRLARLDALFDAHPTSEPALVRSLSTMIPADAFVYLGNSLPIREWDLAASRRVNHATVGANRGANGIDGQLSTFLGMCRPNVENWAVLGDLTTLYDLGGPWALQTVDAEVVRIVVLNNGGGQIFSRMYGSETFLNAHAIDFEGWASWWKLGYERWSRVPDRPPSAPRTVIEVRPDPESTRRFYDEYELLDDL